MTARIRRLLPRHHRIIDLALEGKSRKEIAEIVALTARAISNITGSPVFQNELSRRRRELERKTNEAIARTLTEVRQRAGAAAMGAVDTHLRLLRSKDPRVAQKAAMEILDRAGVGSKDSAGHKNT